MLEVKRLGRNGSKRMRRKSGYGAEKPKDEEA